MQIRREPAMCLVVALIAIWVWTGAKSTSARSAVSVTEKEHTAAVAPRDPLVDAVTALQPSSRDPFLEPSETSPLPPRVLPFPPRQALPVVALPLEPGPFPAAYAGLRVAGAVEPFNFGSVDAADPGSTEDVDDGSVPIEPALDGGGAAPAGVVSGGEAGGGDKTYDQVFLIDRTYPLLGYVRNANKYDLHGKRNFSEPVVFDQVAVGRGGKILKTHTLQPDELQRVELADTLRNRIEIHRRTLSDGESSRIPRRDFMHKLLLDAREHAWIYPIAAEEADVFVRVTAGSIEGYRFKIAVLREQGDLSGEWKLYQELPPELQGSSFQLANQGEFEARLGLDADAERHLREAVAVARADAHAHDALARFLLARGRPREALVFAQAARRNAAGLATDEERFEVGSTLLAVCLALGETREARGVLPALPTTESTRARRDINKGAVEYAAGDRSAANAAFTNAISASQAGAAALGQAACRVLDGKWRAAETALQAIVDGEPILRHRGLEGLGLLYLRTGNNDAAVTSLGLAVEVDPRDAYAHYLLGRARRLSGDLEGAVEALLRSLALADDFAEAMAELSATYLAQAGGATEAPELLYKARRYIDRAIELDAERQTVESAYLELQGVVAFRGADLKGARAAFGAGSSVSQFCRIGVALVENARNRSEQSRGLLTELVDNLSAGHPTRKYAVRTIELIDDHREKEQLRDAFERSDLGDSWDGETNSVRPALVDGKLVMKGRIGSQARAVLVRRTQPTAGNFISVGVSLQRGATDRSRLAALQLVMSTRRGSNQTHDFRARIGFRDRAPYLIVEDGDATGARDDEELRKWDPVDLGSLDFQSAGPSYVGFRLVPTENGRQFNLQALWDGAVVHERQLQKLNKGTRYELHVELVAEGTSRLVDVAFDDFHLVRRKEN